MYHMRHCRIAGTNNNNNDDAAAASAWKGGLAARGAEMVVAGKKWPKYIRSGPFHEHIWPSH